MDLFHIGIYFCKFAGHGWFHQRLASRPFWRRRLLLLRRLCLRQFLRYLAEKCAPKYIQKYWWLRSPGSVSINYHAWLVGSNGDVVSGGVVDRSYGREDRRTRPTPSTLGLPTRMVTSALAATVSTTIPTGAKIAVHRPRRLCVLRNSVWSCRLRLLCRRYPSFLRNK